MTHIKRLKTEVFHDHRMDSYRCNSVILIFMFIGNYNGLVGLRNAVKTAWAQIDVQLKRRYDLIPNLVETVKGYKNFESSTLQAVTNARSAAQAGANASPAARADLEGALSGALSRLMAVVEAYPDLKANQNFMALQEQLTSTENQISSFRQTYNNAVLKLNNKVQMFPSNIIAGITGFKIGEFFEVKAPEEKQPVKVNFS
jgi:LemA protein